MFFHVFCQKPTERASSSLLQRLPPKALDPEKRLTADDVWSFVKRPDGRMAGVPSSHRLSPEALRHHFVEDPKALKAAGRVPGGVCV